MQRMFYIGYHPESDLVIIYNTLRECADAIVQECFEMWVQQGYYDTNGDRRAWLEKKITTHFETSGIFKNTHGAKNWTYEMFTSMAQPTTESV